MINGRVANFGMGNSIMAFVIQMDQIFIIINRTSNLVKLVR